MTGEHWPYPGSRWWKFDFHTYTPASKDTIAWRNAVGTPDEVGPERWLRKYMAAGIDCVAITDHNSGAWIDRLKDAYARMQANPPAGFREICLFPEVEISVQGGFHLLAVFKTTAMTSDLDTLLGRVGYHDQKGGTDGVTRSGAAEVVRAVIDAGGLAIPAHVDQTDAGLLALQPGSHACRINAATLRQLIEQAGILAIELIDAQALFPEEFTKAGLRWARVLGSDCHTFQGAAIPGSRYTWVKMALVAHQN